MGNVWELHYYLISGILTASNGIVSIQTAMNVASQMISALYGPIFGQFDPEEVGSRSRAMRIGEEYAYRLNSKSMNLKDNTIEDLSRSYPSHGFVIDFVIDFDEARRIFNNVRQANKYEIETINALGRLARLPLQRPKIKFLSQNEVCKNDYEIVNNIRPEKETPRRKTKKNG